MAQYRKSLQPQVIQELAITRENGGADYLFSYQVFSLQRILILFQTGQMPVVDEYLVRKSAPKCQVAVAIPELLAGNSGLDRQVR